MTQAFLIFHLNLAFSSIAETQRPTVIERCYTPLLDLAEEQDIPLGIELTGWTLRRIAELAPAWIARLRRLLAAGRCELVGSGHTQMIGPLTPWQVNVWNQQLGLDDYRETLGVTPVLVLVNEMAYASGLVPVYRDAGYAGLVMDRDNVRLALDLQEQPYDAVPSHALGPAGEALPVLWTDSILFQKLQRFAHGEISLADYLHYFRKRAGSGLRPLAAYCNDAEIFDFRPGRFAEEAAHQGHNEWQRVADLLRLLANDEQVEWLSPSAALAASLAAVPATARTLTSIRQPVPVKKQAKYNLARWAVSGRNDLWLNSACHRRLRELDDTAPIAARRELCELWASDLRTHITTERWQAVRSAVAALNSARLSAQTVAAPATCPSSPATITGSACAPRLQPPAGWSIAASDDGILLHITTADLHAILKLRRGLTLHSLAFRYQDFVPVVGTLPHGYFESIEYGADYYTGGVIVELPGDHRRVTDLVPVSPTYRETADGLLIEVQIETANGVLCKSVLIPRNGEQLRLCYAFPHWKRPRGIVRVGTTTLLPEAFGEQLTLACHNGGRELERFALDRNCDHTHPSSTLVSSTTGFGASGGEIFIGDARRALRLSWDPAHTAAFPMLIHQRIPPAHLTRIIFSLGELDDTLRPEGYLPEFAYSIEPACF
jgi:hypothetical protein